MKNMIKRFLKDESGATAIEYGLIAAILSVGIITTLGLVGDELNETYRAVETELKNAR
jgi:pilus assembly protein Flp/PilA